MQQKNKRKTFLTLRNQIKGSVSSRNNPNKMIVAYEPLWSIGTGKVPNSNELRKIFRFIKIIKPNKIFLGEKDMQQLKIIEHFINKNQIKTKVVSCKTVREKNGIACSSRNFLLSSDNISIASKVYKLLCKSKKLLISEKSILKKIKNKIYKLGVKKIDYIKLIDINKQMNPYKKNKKYKIFIAYYLDSTRLIDNI